MIPTLLLPGLVIGRWWLVPIAAVGWPVLLIIDGVGTGNTWGFTVSAGALAAGNVGIAVGVHRGAVYLLRRLGRLHRDPIGEATGHRPDP